MISPLVLVILGTFFLWAPTLVTSRQTGAPFDSCLTLTPKHGSAPTQPPKTSPYVIEVTSKNIDEKSGKETIQLSIGSPIKKVPFKGFVLQARYANNPDIIVDGEFIPNEGELSRTYTCKPGESMMKNNTWTHRSNVEKQQVTASWIPPEDFSETIIFVGTVVKDKANFWEHQHSGTVMMGSLIGLEENETLKPDTQESSSSSSMKPDEEGMMESTTDSGTDHSNMENEGEEAAEEDKNKFKGPSAMDSSAFASSNWTEEVASTKSAAGSGTAVEGVVVLLMVVLVQFV